MRDRGTFDQDKENEVIIPVFVILANFHTACRQPLPLSPLKGRGAAPLSRHHGLRPLTLTNLCLDAKDSLTPRRTVSLFNGAKRLSPLFYVSHGRQERSSLTRSSTELNPRRVSLPPQCLSRIRTDDTTRIQSETHLTSRLEEEMKLTARLRNDLIELQDRACAKLSQSELQVQALAAAVDARECFIKDLAARVELLRVENQVLKKANRRGFCQDVPAEALTASIGEDVPILSPIINTQELGNGMVRLANDKSRQFEPLRSVQERKLGQRYSMGSGIAFRCISSTCGDREMDNISGDPASWFSMGSISEPTLEPRRASAAQIRVSPPAYTFHNAEIGEYAVENGTSLQDIEIQFPTICPDFPPCHAAAFERRKAALPSSSALIYEVDGTALAASRQCNDIHMQDSVCLDSPRLRDPPYCSANDESDSAPLAHNETWFGQGRCLMMQRDSPFYAVPASAFILPRVLPTVSA